MTTRRIRAAGFAAAAAAGILVAAATPASATTFPISGGGSCSASTYGYANGTKVVNVTCAYVRAQMYTYASGGSGYTTTGSWTTATASVYSQNNDVTNHGAQAKIGTATSSWYYF